jgi:hypothetical protein
MKTKRLILESFVKRIIKEEMESQMSISKMIYLYNEANKDLENLNVDDTAYSRKRNEINKLFQNIKGYLTDKANQTAKKINEFYESIVEIRDLRENNINLRFFFGKGQGGRPGSFSAGYRSFIIELKLINNTKTAKIIKEPSLFNTQEMSPNYDEILEEFENDIFNILYPDYRGAQLEESKNKRLTLESFKSLVKKTIKEEMTKVKQWNGTAQAISEALKLWPKDEEKPILGVEYNQWTFDSYGDVCYGDTPLEALYECAVKGAQAEQNDYGNQETWEGILNYLTS